MFCHCSLFFSSIDESLKTRIKLSRLFFFFLQISVRAVVGKTMVRLLSISCAGAQPQGAYLYYYKK